MRPDVSTVRTEPVVVEVAKYTPSPGTEVKVGGLVWAGTNVGRTAGTFADNNSTGGLYGGSYQFNRLKGRPVLSSSDPDSWDPSVAPGSPNGWAPSNDPCPPGWRVPSQNEWIALYANVVKSIAVAYTRVWELKDGSKFELPAGGKRNHNDGRTEYMYETGYYWTSSPDQNFSNIRAHYVGIKIDSDKVTLGPDVTGLPYQSGGSVRCVRSAN